MPVAEARPAKIGTQPWLVYVDKRYKIAPGRRIRLRDAEHGSVWFFVRVTAVNPDGYFFAEL